MNTLLLVDADPRRLNVLEISLRQSGYDVTTADDGADALEKMEWDAPELVVADTHLPVLDGFAFVQTLRKHPELAAVPVVFLASEPSEADEKNAFDLGADDYLPRPVYVRDLAARIRLLLVNRARESADARLFSVPGQGQWSGSTRDMALADLLQDIYGARATGIVRLRSGSQSAQVFFRDGNVVDAQLGHLRGEEAVYRALLWDDAAFDVKFKPVLNEDVIHCTTQTLVLRGMNRVDEWLHLCACAEPLAAALDVTPTRLLTRLSALGEVPEPLRAMALPPVSRDSDKERLQAAPIVARPAPSRPLRASEAGHQVVGSDRRRTMIIGPGRAPRAAIRIVVPREAIPPSAPAAEAVEATAAPGLSSGAVLRTAAIAGSDSDSPANPGLPADPISPSPDVEAVEPTATVGVHSSPSSPPWTHEAQAHAEPAHDADVHAAGVPRAFGRATKRIGGAVLGVAVVLSIVVSLHSVRSRQLREAEQARGAPSVAGPPAEPATLFAARDTPAEVRIPAKPSDEAPGRVAGDPDGLAPASPMVTPPKDVASAASRAAVASPRPARETPLDTRLAVDSYSPLVRDAQRLLLRGDTARALEVAQKAVSSAPSDADTWLTLAAARLAAGDSAGAADAYGACVAQARTAGVTHCRAFARRVPPGE